MESISDTTLKREPLSIKKAAEFLLNGTLKSKVCKYCLNISYPLFELDQFMQIAGEGHETIYKVTIRDMISCFHPFQANNDPNLPNKICNKCLNQTISSYLFTQQCERAQRAIVNCFIDIDERIDKLDSLDRPKKRGRQKLNPNYNIIYTEHKKVIDYAEPIINIVNSGSDYIDQSEEPNMNILECPKCWQVLPNMESMLNHAKLHPKSMWCHCRICGKSFAKRNQLKKHIHYSHTLGKDLPLQNTEITNFTCNSCGVSSDNYIEHLQHVEKHKFKMALEHIVDKKIDKLCTICLNKSVKLTDLDKLICIHGGCPELTGNRTLYNIVASTIPDMRFVHKYIGTKICEKCLNQALTSYIFKFRAYYVRDRLDTCISLMLDNLNKIIKPETNIFIEIAQDTILPAIKQEDIDLDILIGENEDIDESKLKIDVLEDEFREKSESEESEDEEKSVQITQIVNHKMSSPINKLPIYIFKPKETISTETENPARRVTKTYVNKKLVNGYQTKFKPNNITVRTKEPLVDVCSEFLTFKKKRKPIKKPYKHKFTCPLCNKYFISDYYLKRHVLKHVNKKVVCGLCDNKFHSKFFLYEHVKMVHLLKQGTYGSCKICGRTFIDEKKLNNHERSHEIIQCQLCDKVFQTQRHYNSHMQRHAIRFNVLKRKRPKTCSFCETECSNDNKLSLHVNKVHLQIKPYGCDMCEKQFYAEANLSEHKKVHSLLSMETCNLCNRQLKCRRDLVVHVRKHMRVKPHQCQVCGETFYSELSLKRHMKKIHGGQYCCKSCKLVFANKKWLKEHICAYAQCF